MKYCLFFLLILFTFCCFSQPTWKCIYSDSAIFKFPDSFAVKFREDMKEKNFPDEAIDMLLAKIQSGPVSKTRTRYVKANVDSTLIEMEVAEEGSLRLDAFDAESILLKQNELYFMTPSGNYDSLLRSPSKVFNPSGRQPVFFNYTCREYISTDSSCTIWVAEELPSCINPGIRIGNIKGAVLFYEMKSIDATLVRCGISKMTRVDTKN